MKSLENQNPERVERLERPVAEDMGAAEISEEKAQEIFDKMLEIDDTTDKKTSGPASISFKGFSAF